MSNGVLCVGGPCDGIYHSVDERRDLFHRNKIKVESFRGRATYKVWLWIDNDRLFNNRRFYLIPEAWDGFELLDHMEKRAYPEDRE
jgi:hypothetical protein